MQAMLTKADTLPHLDYEDKTADPNDPNSLRNQVSSTDGRIVIVAAFGCSLVVNYSFSITSLNADIQLQTPVGNVTLASAKLDPSNPNISIGGSIGPFKAEANVNFNFSTMVLSASGEVCAPLLGCKKGSISVHV